jgi:hypothetical protein
MWELFKSDGEEHFQLQYIATKDNLADLMTKSNIKPPLFSSLCNKVIRSPPDLGEC